MPIVDTGDLEYPPFVTPDNIGKKLGDTIKAKVTTPHRPIETAGQADRIAINIKINENEYTLGLNKTNRRKLVELLGKNSDNWVGKIVTLVRSEANNPRTLKTVPAIRIG